MSRRDRKVAPTPADAAGSNAPSRPTKRDIDRQLRWWPPRRIAAWSLGVLAMAIIAQHVIAHGGFRPLPFSMGLQDIFVGYPAGGLLAIVALIVADPRPRI